MTRHPAVDRLGGSLAFGAVVAVVVAAVSSVVLGLLVGIAVMAASFVVVGLVVLWPMTAEQTRARAAGEDFNPRVDEFLIVLVALAGVGGIAAIQVLRDSDTRTAAAAIGLLGVFMIWAMLHLMYSARYARLYYTEPVGGIDFNDDEPPGYRDFLYFAFNLGMTYQVSDTSVSRRDIRAMVLRHCVLSYVFGTVILAATINLVAGLVTG